MSENDARVQRARWAAAAAVRRRWHPQRTALNRPETDALLRAARLRPGMRVLDLAGGAGEPALRTADLVGPSGRVTFTDLVPEMLLTAKALARPAGLTNLRFVTAAMESIPFPAARFDVVTCRLGLMYCTRPDRALDEMYRVLRPGGRVALLTLGPLEENPLMTVPVAPMQQRVQSPPPSPGTPDVFRYARPEILAKEVREAGFREVTADARRFALRWPGTVEELLAYQQEFHGLWRPLLDRIPAEQHLDVIAEVRTSLEQYRDGDEVVFPAVSVLARGVR